MNWSAKLLTHRNEKRIAVYFDKNADFIARIKQIDDARWSQTLVAWHLPDTENNRLRFKIKLASHCLPSLEGKAQIEKFTKWLLAKRYSPRTIKTYTEALKSFLVFYREKAIQEISSDDVIVYTTDFVLRNNLSESYQNQIINAIKLYFKTVRDTKVEIEKIQRPKRAKALPNVLSKEEVKLILEAHSNLKHKMMLSLIYSCGLRCGELLALQPTHIDSKRNIVLLKNSKGKKDRIVPLSPKILQLLRDYYILFKPEKYLFEGNLKG